MPPLFGYWRELGARYVTAVCTMPDIGELGTKARVPAPSPEELESLAAAAPPMTGAEYLTVSVLRSLWEDIDAAFRSELTESRQSVQDFLTPVGIAKFQRAHRDAHLQSGAAPVRFIELQFTLDTREGADRI